MTRLAFPSEQFPREPGLSLTVPDGWEPVTGTPATIAVTRPEPADVFRPNVLVSVTRVTPDATAESLLDALPATLTDKRDLALGEPFTMTLAGIPVAGRDGAWRDEQAGTLVQINIFGVVLRGTAPYSLQVTGTIGAARKDEDAPVVHDIISSLTITDTPGV